MSRHCSMSASSDGYVRNDDGRRSCVLVGRRVGSCWACCALWILEIMLKEKWENGNVNNLRPFGDVRISSLANSSLFGIFGDYGNEHLSLVQLAYASSTSNW